MNILKSEAKTKDDAIKKLLEENNLKKEDIVYKAYEQKGGLLKGTKTIIEAATYDEIALTIKDFLKNLLLKMNLEVSFESKIRDNQLVISMFSNNNPILIGKNGQTLKALETVVKQLIYNELGVYPYISLDVENYKSKQISRLERLAKNVAREVGKTKIEVELENMNSYERRIIHNALTNNKYAYTESKGEEPNRHVVIKPTD